MSKSPKTHTFLAQIDPKISECATVFGPVSENIAVLSLIEPNKAYNVSVRTPPSPHHDFSYISIFLNSCYSVNILLPSKSVPLYIHEINNKAAKILFSSVK